MEMVAMAGLTRLQYVFFYPESGDIVLAGPAEGFGSDSVGRIMGVETRQPCLQLDDVIVALRTFGPGRQKSGAISVSIDPTEEGLARMQQTLNQLGGSFRSAADAAVNPFTQDVVAGANDGGISLATPGCALYSYDLPASENGVRNVTEQLGFRLLDGAIQAGTSATSCNAGGTWQTVTDPGVSTVTVLTFQYLDGSGVAAAPQLPFVAATGVAAGVTWAVCTRLIQITLTGQLQGDPNVTHTLTQSVRVRNDWFRTVTASCA
jgi:type II secretory pathway component PulJ